MYLLWCLLVSLIGFSIQDKVKVSVYYETLCPGSQEFITTELYPAYQKLGDDALTVELFPFVKTIDINNKKNKTKYRLTCLHGKNECSSSKVHACVLNLNATLETKISFINCNLESEDLHKKNNIKKCLRKYKLAWTDIKDCIKDEATQYLVDYHKKAKSLEPPISYVPHILFNDQTNRADEVKSREDLLEVVCSKFQQDKPSGCIQDEE